MKKTFFKILILTILTPYISVAQLVETGIDFNPVLQGKHKTVNTKSLNDISDTINLPIIEDFSERSIYPSHRFWIDSNVFINNQFCDTPIFVGVATFDCLDKNGKIYPNANSFTFVADTLVSRYINLDFSPADSVYLSFYYQPQGLAFDPPETRDSLVLKFKAPGTRWRTVWSTPGEPNKKFTGVMIPITDSIYLQKGFQMQFLNYASMSSDNRSSNGDYWNLDLVYLDTGRSINDTLLADVGFATVPGSYIIDYYSVPCKHFYKDYDAKANVQSFRNTSNETIGVDRELYSKPSNSNTVETRNIGGSIDLPPFTFQPHSFVYSPTLFPPVDFIEEDSLTYEIKTVLHLYSSVPQEYLWNDTSHFTQKFYNYYAYDDGTPEAGIGMDGIESEGGMLAVKFYPYKEDTLQAIKFWFNRTNKNVTENLAFDLLVWDNDNGKPGNIIYEQNDQFVRYGDSLNNYVFYILDEPFLVSDTFFVGFRQNHEEYLNLGFDKNNDKHEKTFYSFGSWQQSYHKGAIMIRPVFGDRIKVSAENINAGFATQIYPNPAKEKAIIESSDIIQSIEIYNVSGILLRKEKNIISKTHTIYTADLPKGIYLIKIKTQNHFITKKLLIQ